MWSSGLGSTNRIKSIFLLGIQDPGPSSVCLSLRTPTPTLILLTLQPGETKQGLQLVPCVWNALPCLSCLANAYSATVSPWEGFPHLLRPSRIPLGTLLGMIFAYCIPLPGGL